MKKMLYLKGIYKPRLTITEILETIDIQFEKENVWKPHIDIETLQEKNSLKDPDIADIQSPSLIYSTLHRPISIAITSNLSESKVFGPWQPNGDFVAQSVQYMVEMAQQTAKICMSSQMVPSWKYSLTFRTAENRCETSDVNNKVVHVFKQKQIYFRAKR